MRRAPSEALRTRVEDSFPGTILYLFEEVRLCGSPRRAPPHADAGALRAREGPMEHVRVSIGLDEFRGMDAFPGQASFRRFILFSADT